MLTLEYYGLVFRIYETFTRKLGQRFLRSSRLEKKWCLAPEVRGGVGGWRLCVPRAVQLAESELLPPVGVTVAPGWKAAGSLWFIKVLLPGCRAALALPLLSRVLIPWAPLWAMEGTASSQPRRDNMGQPWDQGCREQLPFTRM